MSTTSSTPRSGPSPIVRAIVALAVVVGGGTWWAARTGYVAIPGVARAAATSSADRIVASGTIESDTSTMSAEVAGRLVAFEVRDGDLFTAGKLVARIEDPVLSAQLDQARASLSVADASLANLRAGSRPEDVRAAEAVRDVAKAQLDGARAGQRNTEAIRARPQELDARLNQGRLALDVARTKLAQLEAGGRAEEVASAVAALDIAKARLAQLEAGGRDEDVAAAQAALDVAKVRLAQLEAGGREEDVAAAQAQLEVARTRLAQLDAGARAEERRRADAAVAASKAQVAAAENRLAQVVAGPRAGDLAAARAVADQSQTRLDQMREGTPRAEDVAQARLAWEAAAAAYLASGQAVEDARTAFDAATRLKDSRISPSMSAEQVNLTYAQAQQSLHAAEAARDQRQFGRDSARAAYDRALAGPTAWDRRLAEEAVDQARAQLQRVQEVNAFDVTSAQTALDAARAQLVQAEAAAAAITSPTEFDRAVAALGVTTASAQRDKVAKSTTYDIDAARGAVAQAEAALKIRRQPATDRDLEVARLNVKQAEETLAIRRKPATDRDLEVARLAVRQSEVQVTDLEAQKADPLVANAQVDAAAAQTAVAEGNLAAAEARLDAARSGPTSSQIAVAEAQVQQARAAVKVLEAQVGKGAIVAPRTGTVVRAIAHLGETVVPGTSLLTWHDATDLTITAYVSESDVGRLRAEQPVTVAVDSFPGESFVGTVRSISTQAEFTPRNVQAARDRVNLVFAVKVAIDAAGGRLKAGMPADVTIDLAKSR
jgi:HlyD family secretion protein